MDITFKRVFEKMTLTKFQPCFSTPYTRYVQKTTRRRSFLPGLLTTFHTSAGRNPLKAAMYFSLSAAAEKYWASAISTPPDI